MASKKQPSKPPVSHSLKDLKKIMKQKKSQSPVQTAPPKTVKAASRVSDEQAFLDAMKEVQEIKEFRSMPVHHKKRKIPARIHKKGAAPNGILKGLEDIVKGRQHIDLSNTQEYVEWVHPDFSDHFLNDLHVGRYSVQDSLDIHGLILDEAEIEVDRFIRKSITKSLRCIKIIHGRGLRSPNGPVLKSAVVHWLSRRFRKFIVAFVTARRCDGGLGALYILLR
jgi:DNA-nicking Smr family endonuclease